MKINPISLMQYVLFACQISSRLRSHTLNFGSQFAWKQWFTRGIAFDKVPAASEQTLAIFFNFLADNLDKSTELFWLIPWLNILISSNTLSLANWFGIKLSLMCELRSLKKIDVTYLKNVGISPKDLMPDKLWQQFQSVMTFLLLCVCYEQ